MGEREMLGPERVDIAACLGGGETREPGTARRSEFDNAVRTARHEVGGGKSINRLRIDADRTTFSVRGTGGRQLS
jgi:hypothetical protein